jgi:hypothetical protein
MSNKRDKDSGGGSSWAVGLIAGLVGVGIGFIASKVFED